MEDVRFVVLGGGTAGLTAAKQVAQDGGKVVVIDPQAIGGLCSLSGCNPKKIFARAVEVLDETHNADMHGVHDAEQASIDWQKIMRRKRRFTDPVTDQARRALDRAGIEHIKGTPHFLAPGQLAIGDRTLRFEGLLIATGSTPRRLAFPGAQHVHTSDELLRIRTPPKEMAIIGGGVVALEFAHIFSRVGTKVAILAHSDRMLRAHDADIVERLVKHSQHIGIEFRFSVEPLSIVRDGSGGFDIALSNGQSLHTDYVLNAAGRVLACEGLDLDRANIEYSEKGIRVNEYLRCPQNDKVFVAGDARGKYQLTPVAAYEARLAVNNFLHGDKHVAEYAAIPSAVFTVPPLASVGISEEQARNQNMDYEVVYENMSSWIAHAIEGENPAFAKVVYGREQGHVLGAHLFGPNADDIINIFAMAIRYGITRDRLREMIYVYPSLTSDVKYLI